jgi:hypothetical protein
MEIFRSRTAAFCVAALLALVAVVTGGARSLGRIRTEAANLFFLPDAYGNSGFNDLKERAFAAYGFLTVAKRSLPADTLAEAEAAQAALTETLTRSGDIGEIARANLRLTQALTGLEDAVAAAAPTEEDLRQMRRALADIESRNSTATHGLYNERALAYNQLLRGFPGGLLALLGQARPLALFSA